VRRIVAVALALLLLLVVDTVGATLVQSPSIAIAQSAGGATTFPTQTPVPVAAGRLQPFAYGVASGDMTADSAILWTRTPDAADVTAEISSISIQQSLDSTARRLSLPKQQLVGRLEQATLLNRLPTTADTARLAAFLASDGAQAITGAIVNASSGSAID
jgi:hypothetical protein